MTPPRAQALEPREIACDKPRMLNPTRREILQGAAAVAGGTLLPSCAHTSAGPALPAAPELPGGLSVKGTRFIKGGKPFNTDEAWFKDLLKEIHQPRGSTVVVGH